MDANGAACAFYELFVHARGNVIQLDAACTYLSGQLLQAVNAARDAHCAGWEEAAP